ncbi:MAG: RecQ family ATP-dependent DNA helicase [Gemmatimonadota bacterium]
MAQKKDGASQILRSLFGHDAFRPGQADIVRAVASGRDLLAVLPTGAGKSICFQVPALLAAGPTLVVSPLIALMENQVSALRNRGIRAVAVTSASSAADRREAAARLLARGPSLVYVSPERLASASFRRLTSASCLSRIVVDEAHCISEWGHDFRPDYLTIGAFARGAGSPPMAAFTATATPSTRADIVHQLGLRRPVRIVHSVDRPTLYWEVARAAPGQRAFERIARAVGRRGHGAALVYVQTRALSTAVAAALRRAGHRADAYHAGLPVTRRAMVQERFLSAPRGVVVATCAFGMGIDHPSIRLVAHLGMPGALETYVQEAGRAGRDGHPARCLLVVSRQDSILHLKRLRALDGPTRSAARARLSAMTGYVRERVCRRAAISRWFEEPDPVCHGCDLCAENGV